MRFFLRNAVWFPYFILVLIGYLPTYIYLSWLNKKGRTEEVDRIAAKVVPKWARKILKAAGITVEVSGLENIPKGAVVFAANHQGYFDIPLLLGYLDRPYGFVAKVETKDLPVISGWMRLLRCVFLNRENPRKGLVAINQGIEIVKNGHSMILFPEGTTSDGDDMLPFRTGALRIATKANVPVVPVVINGTYKVMVYVKDGVTPAHLKLTVLPPVDVPSMDKERRKELPIVLHDLIETELKKQLGK